MLGGLLFYPEKCRRDGSIALGCNYGGWGTWPVKAHQNAQNE